MLQNMYVVQDGAAYTALTDLTREVLYSSPSAGLVVQSAIDAQRKEQSFDRALTERFIAIQTQRDEL